MNRLHLFTFSQEKVRTYASPYETLPAVLLSLVIHGLIYSAWPHLHAQSSLPPLVQGELVPPPIPETTEPPPIPELPIEPEPPPSPPTPKSIESPIKREIPAIPPPDAGVALPVLADQSNEANSTTNDYVVAATPPLNPEDKIPFGSKVGATPIAQYAPTEEVNSQDNHEDFVDRNILAEYGQGLREKSSQFGSYPAVAKKRRWQGIVKIIVRYARTGVAYEISIKDSSGHKILDDQALSMVKQACLNHTLPEALKQKAFSLIVPIEFKMM